MPNSNELGQQIMTLIGQMNPMIDSAGSAPGFFKKGIADAYGNGLPLLKEGANLEAGAYALPGQLMNQYDQEFGGITAGPSSTARLNSILGRLGSQFGMVDLASKLAERQGARQEDMAKSLTDQYMLGIQGMKDKYSMLSPLYQTAVGREDAAAARAASRGGGGASSGFDPFKEFSEMLAQRAAEEAALKAQKTGGTPAYLRPGYNGQNTMTGTGLAGGASRTDPKYDIINKYRL